MKGRRETREVFGRVGRSTYPAAGACGTTARILSHTAATGLLVLLLTIASCGGNGSGGASGLTPESIVIPETYDFTMNLSPDPGNPLRISSSGESLGEVALTMVELPLAGSYSFETSDYTLNSGRIINVRNDAWDEPYRTFDIRITSDITGNTTAGPQSGSFTVYDGRNVISVIISGNTATVSLNDGAATKLAWQAFSKKYLSESEGMGMREASLAATMLTLLTDGLSFAADTLETIATRGHELVSDPEHSISLAGDELPPTLPQGESMRTLRLESGDTVRGSNYTWLFDYYWYNDPASQEDLLINGTVSMRGLDMTVEKNKDTTELLVSTGFDEVRFEDLTVYTTLEDDRGNVFIEPGRTLVYTGGYAVSFYAEPGAR